MWFITRGEILSLSAPKYVRDLWLMWYWSIQAVHRRRTAWTGPPLRRHQPSHAPAHRRRPGPRGPRMPRNGISGGPAGQEVENPTTRGPIEQLAKSYAALAERFERARKLKR
jgi:hypothetical protein